MKALFFALGALCIAQAAEASPCGDKIAALESRAQKNHVAGDPGAAESPSANANSMAAESTDAKLHHQPSAGTTGDATQAADSPASRKSAHFQVLIEQARAANDSGDAAECEASAKEAEKALTP